MTNIERAKQLRLAIQFQAAALPDEQAAQVPAVFPLWDAAGVFEPGTGCSTGSFCTNACNPTPRRQIGHQTLRYPCGYALTTQRKSGQNGDNHKGHTTLMH